MGTEDQHKDEPAAFESKLPPGKQRFLAQVIEHGFDIGLRTPADFLRHFSPQTIMQALAEHPTRRARILEVTMGLRPRIAMRKTPESSGEDLQIALDEGETTAEAILELFEPDDRIRFLDPQYLWAYIVEPRLWHHESTQSALLPKVRSHTAFIVERALDQGLIRAEDVVNALSVPTLVEALPRDDVAAMLERALIEGRNGNAFDDEHLLNAVGMRAIVENVPLATTWEWVISAKIASPVGLTAENEALFDADEAHPDAQEVTVLIDPTATETVPGVVGDS